LKQVIDRVVDKISSWAIVEHDMQLQEQTAFSDELKYLLVSQSFSFNSPVWFNLGVPNVSQQGSACFILKMEDTMPSILNWISEEGMIFKGGSGSGVNLSAIRASVEKMSGGGVASGPISFMRGADASAGAIKSGGKTRRAAKMVVLDADHPDVEEFIWCKAHEERKARVLRSAGYDVTLNGKDISSLQFQNANNSVRLSDEFMQSAIDNESWVLRGRVDRDADKEVAAKDILRQIAAASWECADPGVHFIDTIQRWHTLPLVGPITSSNPCGEYLSIDNSACNLGSLNLLKFLNSDGLQTQSFLAAIRIAIYAMDAIAGKGDYPTLKIAKNAARYRQLGLGFTGLGASLMTLGLPYDSDRGRDLSAAVASLMSARAYQVSCELASRKSPFFEWETHKESMLKVLKMHKVANTDSAAATTSETARDISLVATKAWASAVASAESDGVRNSQVSVIAPTGTISFMMDSQTTGIEPDFALVKHKTLVGGGAMRLVSSAIKASLKFLEYSDEAIDSILNFVETSGTVIGAPGFDPTHSSIFATAVGENSISYVAHLSMLAAVQPFLSGAASKTINLPATITVEEVEQLIILAWRLGIKDIAIYRDGCKMSQPLKTDSSSQAPVSAPVRTKLPDAREGRTISFRVGELKGYATVGLYDNGNVGEIFLKVAKQGSTLAGIMDAFSIAVSQGLQYGVPLERYCEDFIGTRFEPHGITSDPEIRIAASVLDYVFRKLALNYLDKDALARLDVASHADLQRDASERTASAETAQETLGAICYDCGGVMIRTGSCYSCESCGTTTGCG
jgi:ribonucleoside-diphosphate reductase alpha chain